MKLDEKIVPRWSKRAIVLMVLIACSALFCRDVSGGAQVREGQGGASLATSPSDSAIQSLTQEERAWLKEHPVISVVQDPSWPPVEFTDENGHPSGISNDYLRLIEERLGVKFERTLSLNWQDSYARLKRWDIDMTTCVAPTPERERFWAFTRPYMNIPIVILTRTDVTYIGNIRELNRKKVAVVDGYAAGEWLLRDFPDIPLVKVRTVKEGLDLLQKGAVFAFVDNMLVMNYYLAKFNLSNLKISGWTPYTNSQCMAVRKDWAILAGILEKELDSIPESEIGRIYQKWVPLQYERGFNYTLLWQALAVFAVILSGLLYWNRKLSGEIVYRKKAESALRKNEQFLNSIVENIPIMVFMKDAADLRYITFNRACEELLGYSREELSGKTDYDFFPKQEADFFTMKDRDVLQHGQLVEIPEETIQTKRLGQKILRTKKIVIVDDKGKPKYLLGISEDITERKKTEESLRESEERYRNLLEVSPIGIFVHSEGKVVFANTACAKLLGADTEEQIIGKPIIEIIHPDGLEKTQSRIKRLIAGESGIYPAEDVYLKLDGSSINVEVVATSLPYKGKPAVQAIVTDITERRKAEKVQRRLVTAIEQVNEGILVTDTQGIIQYVNPSLENISGYDKTELLGTKSNIFKSAEHNQEFFRDLWDTINAGKVWTGRFTNKKKDGAIYYVDATISPVKDSTGKIINFVAVQRDVTAHLELSKQLFQAQKMEAVGTLAGGVAHDFNNLLQAILGYSELMLQSKNEGEPEYEDLQKIYHAGKRGADLVNGLLTFSRKVETKYVPVDLNQEITSVRSLLSRTIPKTINIDLHLEGNLESIKADPSQISQVLMNLGVNARDTMLDGGTLSIETTNIRLDEEYCKSHLEAKPGNYVALKLSDTGQGMDKETLSHIFEPFFSTKGPGKGTGLGLAIVHGIVKQHGGHINCYSEPGLGTTFTIYFPAIQAEQAMQTPAFETTIPRGTETVLLVDDEDDIRGLGATLLSRFGYKVITANNGKEALEAYKREGERISLIVLDLIMPEMDGRKCLAEVLRVNPKAKIIIASGYSESGSAGGAMAGGAKGFVHKPYNMRQLLTTIREILDSD
ncbi:MAG: PAS domain S-box protein [Desulfomonilaceae bacterium]